MAFGGLPRRSAPAFLGSWAYCFKEVADTVGVSTLHGFRSSCPGLAHAWDAAEAALLALGGARRPLPWHDYLAEAEAKQQAVLTAAVSLATKETLLTTLDEESAADLQSNGGTGAGGFLQLPAEGVKPMPEAHFLVSLCDRLLLPVCPEGAHCKHRC